MHEFATVEDYEARYGEVEDTDALEAILEDASRIIAAELENAFGDGWDDSDDEFMERCMQVCRNMAHRALDVETQPSDIPLGATQHNISANGFVEYVGFQSNGSGYGDVYISKSEKKLLGITRQRARSIRPRRGGGCCARR